MIKIAHEEFCTINYKKGKKPRFLYRDLLNFSPVFLYLFYGDNRNTSSVKISTIYLSPFMRYTLVTDGHERSFSKKV